MPLQYFSRLLIAHFLLSVTLQLSAQSPFEVNQYLSQSIGDIEMTTILDQAQFVQEESFKSPILREVEVRGRTRELVSEFDDIRFRIAPLNPWERKANSNYYSLLKEQIQTQKLVDLGKVLNRRYQTLISLYFALQYQSVSQLKSETLEKIKEVYIQSRQSTKDLLEIEVDILKISLEIEDYNARISELEYIIRSSYDYQGVISLEEYDILSIDQLRILVSSLEFSENIKSIQIENEVRKAELSFSEWEIRKQESFSNIGFIQTEYEFDGRNTLKNNMGFKVGIQLPIVNPDKPDLQRRKLDLLEDQNEVIMKGQEVSQRSFQLKNKLENTLQKYDLVSEKIETFSNQVPISPEDVDGLIEKENIILDLQFSQLELHETALSLYINILEEHGLIIERINHISNDKEELEVDW